MTIYMLTKTKSYLINRDPVGSSIVLRVYDTAMGFVLIALVTLLACVSRGADEKHSGIDGVSITNSAELISERLQERQKTYWTAQQDADSIQNLESSEGAVLSTNRTNMDFVRDSRGDVISVGLITPNVNDQCLELLSHLVSVKEITITKRRSFDELTPRGISALQNLPHLGTLRIRCFQGLNAGVFKEICNLRNLRDLELIASFPPEREYICLTNLTKLTELHVNYCTNFTAQELLPLTNLIALRNLELSYDGLSPRSTNMLGRIRCQFTNCIINVKK